MTARCAFEILIINPFQVADDTNYESCGKGDGVFVDAGEDDKGDEGGGKEEISGGSRENTEVRFDIRSERKESGKIEA